MTMEPNPNTHVRSSQGDNYHSNNDLFSPNNNVFSGYDAAGLQSSEVPYGQSWNYSVNDFAAHPETSQYLNDWQPNDLHNGVSQHDNFLDGASFPQGNFQQAARFQNDRDVAAATYSNPYASRTASYEQHSNSYSEDITANEALNTRPTPDANRHGSFDPSSNTITPDALQNKPIQIKQSDSIKYESPAPSLESATAFPQIPTGVSSGKFLLVNAPDVLKATEAAKYREFLFIGKQPLDLPITKGSLPPYNARRSRNEMKRLMERDHNLSTAVPRKSSRGGKTSTDVKTSTSKPKPAGLTQAAISQRHSSKSPSKSSDDESDYSSSSDEEEERNPLPSNRPSTAVGNTEYDSVKALWRPKSRTLPADEIRKGLTQFWDVVKGIRDQWKSDNVALKEAEEKKKTNQLPLLKERVASQRMMLEVALKAAVKHGHPDIIDHFGENMPMMHTFAIFLNERAKELDYNGPFAVTLLELLTMCTNMTSTTLQESKLSKIFERFSKRADARTKTLVKRIVDNCALATKRKRESRPATAASANAAAASKSSHDVGKTPATALTGVKRQRPIESNSEQPAKKANNAPAAKTASATTAKPSVSASKTPSANSAQQKVNQVAAKPSSFFSQLTAVRRQPSAATGNTAPASSAPAVTAKKPVPAAAPKMGFSFAEAFASVSKPKEPEPVSKVVEEETGPPETAEEKSARLRKEERRKLRVTFKPDDALVEVRFFTHDPDEELGHDASQVRDVRDTGSEGRMFKFNAQHKDDEMDIDDDEETRASDQSLFSRSYPMVSLVDFSVVDKEERERMYVPYGGGYQKPVTPERERQLQHESNTLMAIYAARSDIPDTPREAPHDQEYTDQNAKAFGELPQLTMQRLESYERAQQSHNTAAPHQATPDLAALLGALGGQSQAGPAASVATNEGAGPSELDKLLASFSGNTSQENQNTAAGAWLNAQPQSNPLDALMAYTQHAQQQQQQQPTSQLPAGWPQPPPPPPQTPGQIDLNAILASLTPQNQSQQPPIPPPPIPVPGMNGNLAEIMASMAYQQQQGNQQGTQPSSTPANYGYPFENEERRRMREAGGEDTSDAQANQSNVGGSGRGWIANPLKKLNKEGRPVPMFVVPCKYWKEGKCKKGKDCTFVHEGPPGPGQLNY